MTKSAKDVSQSLSRFLALMTLTLLVGLSSTASADDGAFRAVILDVPGGGTPAVLAAVSEIPNVDVHDSAWFAQQLRARGFSEARILESPKDLVWFMSRANVDVIVSFSEVNEERVDVRFITAEAGQTERTFSAGRDEDGTIHPDGARIVRFELESLIRTQGPPADVSKPGPAKVAKGDDDAIEEDAIEEEPDLSDPEVLRRHALREREAVMERLSRDWLWLRIHTRFDDKKYAWKVGDEEQQFDAFAGFRFAFDLELEMFPFSLSSAENVGTGFYTRYYHRFSSLNLVDESQNPPQQAQVGINDWALELGAVYRLDSPLDETREQTRFRVGARYAKFSIDDFPDFAGLEVIPFALAGAFLETVNLVIGARLVYPVAMEELAMTASLDLVPVSLIRLEEEGIQTEWFGYGFGADLGLLYEFFDNGFLSAGFTFRMTRGSFGSAQIVNSEGEAVTIEWTTSDLSYGPRAGIVYQY